MESKRRNFILSGEINRELDLIPAGQRSSFVEKALKNELYRARRDRFIKKHLKGKKPIWTDENHPDLMTLEDIANYNPLKFKKRA